MRDEGMSVDFVLTKNLILKVKCIFLTKLMRTDLQKIRRLRAIFPIIIYQNWMQSANNRLSGSKVWSIQLCAASIEFLIAGNNPKL